MINCMYVYMYVFWCLVLSSLVGKTNLSVQGLLCNYVFWVSNIKVGAGWYFRTDGSCTWKTVQGCVAKSSNKPIPLTGVDYS